MPENALNESLSRRRFFKKVAAVSLGAVAALVPIVTGLTVLLAPLRRKSQGNNGLLVMIAPLAAVPTDGVPRKFTVTADRTDGWNEYRNVSIGAVYLRRTGPQTIEALNVLCPHAGGFIDYQEKCKCFVCPLHNSQFALDGSIQKPRSPSPRAMDSLTVEIRGEEIWVRFENFRTGIAEKIPA
jgi:Rieske Fe-S protein